MTDLEPRTTHSLNTRVLCRHCGVVGTKHRARDGRCPATAQEPRWPSTVKDEDKAGQLFDKRMARHWAKRSTVFEPCG